MRIVLAKGDMLLELDPCAGGSISKLKHRDLDVLRPAPDRCGPAFDPRKYAAFPMTPFVGRIHNGQFTACGKSIELHANLPPEPHAIHGHGWQDVWKVEKQAKISATLLYHHAADAWPWTYDARQTFRLTEDGLIVELSVENLSDTPMPAGLGWHPYFPREGATLIVPTTHIWNVEADSGENSPSDVKIIEDLSRARIVQDLTLDTTFSVETGTIEINWPTHGVTLKSDPIFTHATIFVPPGEDYFCAEPITHAPNAVNSELGSDVTGLKWLEPGQALTGRIRVSVIH
nr:aldose 1-epimerase [Hyphomonas sp. Mor2]